MSRSLTLSALALASVVLVAGEARAFPNLVTNGDFESTSLGTAYQINAAGITSTGTTVTGWTNAGYNFLFTPGSADTSGAYSSQFSAYLKLWGPNGGPGNTAYSANGMPTTSPTGGNFIGADGAYEQGAISQSITGLVVGAIYHLTFNWAAAQQVGYTGATTENWTINLGGSTYTTATVNTPSQGFSPWRADGTYFTATAVTEVLSFLAAGTPSGVPPFSLLDSVSLVYAPEPASWGLMLVGLGAATMFVRRRRSVRL